MTLGLGHVPSIAFARWSLAPSRSNQTADLPAACFSSDVPGVRETKSQTWSLGEVFRGEKKGMFFEPPVNWHTENPPFLIPGGTYGFPSVNLPCRVCSRCSLHIPSPQSWPQKVRRFFLNIQVLKDIIPLYPFLYPYYTKYPHMLMVDFPTPSTQKVDEQNIAANDPPVN